MIKEIKYNNEIISYNLTYKNVKNINLRIKADGQIFVSANKLIPETAIEKFIISKADFILSALDKFSKLKKETKTVYFSETELKNIILDLCNEVYPYYKAKGIAFPLVKFRKMVSRWGSCNYKKGILTFNTNLKYASYECIKYVVYHEFTHFIHKGHQKDFYDELSRVCPGWKIRREEMKKIIF